MHTYGDRRTGYTRTKIGYMEVAKSKDVMNK
jgi:hypothetical protein